MQSSFPSNVTPLSRAEKNVTSDLRRLFLAGFAAVLLIVCSECGVSRSALSYASIMSVSGVVQASRQPVANAVPRPHVKNSADAAPGRDRATTMNLAANNGAETGSSDGIRAATSAQGDALVANTIIIRKGGTYSGDWVSTKASVPAVAVYTDDPVVIENSTITGRGALISIAGTNGANVTIRNVTGTALDPQIAGKARGAFVAAYTMNALLVQNCTMIGTSFGVKAAFSTPSSLKVLDNIAINLEDRASDGRGGFQTTRPQLGHFVYLYQMPLPSGAEIGWNQVVQTMKESSVDDAISVYKSQGTSGHPILIHDNYVEGASSPATSSYAASSFSTAGDSSSQVAAFVSFVSNQVVHTAGYGLTIGNGHDVTASGNRVVSCGKDSAGVWYSRAGISAIALQNKSGAPSFYGNVIGTTAGGLVIPGEQSAPVASDAYASPADLVDPTNNINGNLFTDPCLARGSLMLAAEDAERTYWNNKVTANNQVMGDQHGPVTVTVNPSTATVSASQAQQLSATVTWASDPAVTWTLSSAVGTISASGLYTAPPSVTGAQTVTARATSVQDTTKSATAVFTIKPSAITLTPAVISLTASQPQQYSAVVQTGATSQGITWSITPSVGTISAGGLYTAPATVTNPQTVTVMAISATDPSQTAKATVMLNPSSATAAAPVASPAAGSFTSAQSIALSSSTPGQIRYTTDGSTPTTSSPLYATAISVTATSSIKAIAVASGFTNSPVLSADYTINLPASGMVIPAGWTQSFVGPQTAPYSNISQGKNGKLNGAKPFCPDPNYCSNIYQPLDQMPINTALDAAFHATSGVNTAGMNMDWGVTNASFDYYVYKPSVDPTVLLLPTLNLYTAATGLTNSEATDTVMAVRSPMTGEGGEFLECKLQPGDVHAISVNLDDFTNTETYGGGGAVTGLCNGRIQSSSTSPWRMDLPIEGQFPAGKTESDAAGLPVNFLDYTLEEVQSGVIDHAHRVTAHSLVVGFYQGDSYGLVASPAKHSANTGGGSFGMFSGQRLVLDGAVDITKCGAQAKVILRGLQVYGQIVADIGNNDEMQGVNDPGWDPSLASCLHDNYNWSMFHVKTPTPIMAVDLTPEQPTWGASVKYDLTGLTSAKSGIQGTLIKPSPVPPVLTSYTVTGAGLTGTSPNFSIPLGNSVTFHATATNATTLTINHAGPMVNGVKTWTPTDEDTYILMAQNGNGYDVSGRVLADGGGPNNPPSIHLTVKGTAAAAPTSSVPTATYTSAQTLTLSTVTAGADIHFTSDGTTPNKYSTLYTAPITNIVNTTTYKAVAYKAGLVISPVTTITLTMAISGAVPNTIAVSNNFDLGGYFTAGQPANNGTNQAKILVTATFGAANAGLLTTKYDATSTKLPSGAACDSGAVTGILIGAQSNGMDTIEAGNARNIVAYWFPTLSSGKHTCTITFPAANTPDGSFHRQTYLAEIHGATGIEGATGAFHAGFGAPSPFGCGTVITTGPNRLLVAVVDALDDTVTPVAPAVNFYSTNPELRLASQTIPTASSTGMTFTAKGNSAPQQCISFAVKP